MSFKNRIRDKRSVDFYVGDGMINEERETTTRAIPGTIPSKKRITGDRCVFTSGLEFGLLETRNPNVVQYTSWKDR